MNQLGLAPKQDPGTLVAACELLLEGLVAQKRISRTDDLGYTRVRPDRPSPPYGKGGGTGSGGGGGGPNLFA